MMFFTPLFCQDVDAEHLPFEYWDRSVYQYVIGYLGLEVGHQTNLFTARLLDFHDDSVMLVAAAIRDHLGLPTVGNMKFYFDHADSYVYPMSKIFGLASYMRSKIIHVGCFCVLFHFVRIIVLRLYSHQLFLAIPVFPLVRFVSCVFFYFFVMFCCYFSCIINFSYVLLWVGCYPAQVDSDCFVRMQFVSKIMVDYLQLDVDLQTRLMKVLGLDETNGNIK